MLAVELPPSKTSERLGSHCAAVAVVVSSLQGSSINALHSTSSASSEQSLDNSPRIAQQQAPRSSLLSLIVHMMPRISKKRRKQTAVIPTTKKLNRKPSTNTERFRR
jgi:hypothetical protein